MPLNKPGHDYIPPEEQAEIRARIDDKVAALRFNNGKPRMSLVPSSLNRYCAYGLTYGEVKYTVVDQEGKVLSTGANNWRKGFNWTSIIDSLERHLGDFKEGYDLDDESGLPHLCHMACNLAFLIEHYDRYLGVDDRYSHPSSKHVPINLILPKPKVQPS